MIPDWMETIVYEEADIPAERQTFAMLERAAQLIDEQPLEVAPSERA